MPPFLIFVLVLIVIWTLSGLTSYANKQREAERRRLLREQMARAGVNVGTASSQAQLRRAPVARRVAPKINPGIAQRFPDVLLPPSVQMPRQQQRRPATARPAAVPRRIVKSVRPGAQTRQAVAPPPPIRSTLQQPAPAVAPAAPSRAIASPRVDAAALARWMKPVTLNQQFLLTEILQPPLALRNPSSPF